MPIIYEFKLNKNIQSFAHTKSIQNQQRGIKANQDGLLFHKSIRHFTRILFQEHEKSRLKILEIHTKGIPLEKDVNLNLLMEKTLNYVGADIESLCREAAILALRENMEASKVEMKHFEEALKKVRPSITQEDMKRYEEIEEEYLRTARGAAIREKDLSYMG